MGTGEEDIYNCASVLAGIQNSNHQIEVIWHFIHRCKKTSFRFFFCFYVLLTSLIFKRFLFSSLYSTKLIKFHDKTGQFHSHECLTSTSFIISLFMLSILAVYSE